jgi:RNA polymerase sigma-70 factor (ECF subfamily)
LKPDDRSIGGHEMTASPHVADEMLAHAFVDSPELDPIGALIKDGRHRDALTSCAREHGAILGRLCMALLGSQADADEAVQETLLRAHRGMAGFRGDGTVKAWLCGIARHVCAHTLETRRRGRELLEVVPSEACARDDFAERQRARAIREALAKLKPSERDVLVLRYVAGLSHREIGMACGLDEATARKRISRALSRLRSIVPIEEMTP